MSNQNSDTGHWGTESPNAINSSSIGGKKPPVEKKELADTMLEEYQKQQTAKSEQDKIIDLLTFILECLYGSIYEKDIKLKTLGLLQRAQIPVVTKDTHRETSMALGNVTQIRKWFIDKGLNFSGIPFTRPYKEDCTDGDRVNHPSHYTWLKDLCGIEVIDITRHMDFDLGNATKYILRQGRKSEEGISDKEKTIEDLEKAIWYIKDKIEMIKKGQ